MTNPFILKATSGGTRPKAAPPPLSAHTSATNSGAASKLAAKLPTKKKGKAVSLLNREELERYKNFYAFTRSRVEGHLSGRHKSPFKGSSSDFADYHEYSQGQDIGRIDWRVYGRSRKLYIRRFEEETDMTVYILVDISRSMLYRGADRLPKYIQAARLAAAIAYLASRQRDKVALGLVNSTLLEYRKAGNSRLHLQNLFNCLETVQPADETSLAHALRDCAQVIRKRGRLILISDFHDELADVLKELGQFVHRGFDIQLMHLLDPDEQNLPPSAALEFIDMESSERVKADIDDVRSLYHQSMATHIQNLSHQAMRHQIKYHLLDSSDPIHTGLEAYLSTGGHGRRKKHR
ncbi:MAG: hypothetical protein ACI81V_000499 [Lentimonas sp.]|jgi:uncharacterized protein (DUF58 family)